VAARINLAEAWWWVGARIKGILDGHGSMRSSLFSSSNPHLSQCNQKKKIQITTELAIILVPQFPKTDKPGCELAAQR